MSKRADAVSVEQQLDQLLRVHYADLQKYCRVAGHLPPPVLENSQDVVNQVFLELAEKVLLDNKPLPYNPRPYLFRMAQYLCREKWRQYLAHAGFVAHALPANGSDVFEQEFVDRHVLLSELKTLSGLDESILHLRFLQQLSYDDIAVLHHLRPEAVRQRCRRALARLRARLCWE